MNEDKREQFLLHLYDQLWRSIERRESGLWQFLGLCGIILVYLVASIEKVPPDLAAYLVIVVSFFGIIIAIHSGKWVELNRMMIVNIEKQFLDNNDLGMIIPLYFHMRNPRKFFTGLTVIHISFFLIAIITSFYFYWNKVCKLLIIFLLVAGIVANLCYWYAKWKEIKMFVEHTKNVEES